MKSLCWLCFSLVFILMAAGCSRSMQQLDEDDTKNPYFQSGKKKIEARDFHGAVADFERALELQPRNAQAHFELGLLLDGETIKPNDYPGAIYHYQKFIALRPQSQKVEMLRGFIARDLLALAATVPLSNAAAPQDIDRLKRENEELREKNDQLSYQLDRSKGSPSATSGAESPHPAPASAAAPNPSAVSSSQPPSLGTAPSVTQPSSKPTTAAGRARTYTVQKGDTLSLIARKCLGSSAAADKIYAANRAVLSDKNKLTVGQVLTIPVQ